MPVRAVTNLDRTLVSPLWRDALFGDNTGLPLMHMVADFDRNVLSAHGTVHIFGKNYPKKITKQNNCVQKQP